MKLSEFSLITRNIAGEGAPERMGEWQTASRSNLIALGTRSGKKYQIKLHAAEPKWYNTDKELAKLQAQLAAVSADDFTGTKERLTNEIESLKNSKKRNDENDAASEDYLKIKQNVTKAINAIGSPLITGPEGFWKQEIDFKGGAVYAVEATPWVDGVAVGFNDELPIRFDRDLSVEQQYDIVASLADTLSTLHAAGVLHGDLKLGNTLILKQGGEFKVALIDFDASYLLKDLHSRKFKFEAWNYVVGGTYFSLETYDLYSIVRDSPDKDWYDEYDLTEINEKADIFSLGITIYEYFYGRADRKDLVPFRSPSGELLDTMDYGLAVGRYDYTLDLPDTVSDLLYGALNWMLTKDPAERPTAAQVRDLFKSRDVSKIPSKFTRCPLWDEHRDKYNLVPTPGVSIAKSAKSPLYYVIRSGVSVTRTIDELVRSGWAECLDGSPAAVEEAPDTQKNKYWECDGTGDLPQCVVRASTEGRYLLSVGGVSRSVSFGELKVAGVICSAEELETPWPCDAGLRFISAKKIKRNMKMGKGPGHYIIGDGALAYKYTTQQLIDNGHATRGVSFALWAGDTEKYEPNTDPKAFPTNVKAIMRNSITNHQYRIVYDDGHVEKLMIDAMLAKGYVKLK